MATLLRKNLILVVKCMSLLVLLLIVAYMYRSSAYNLTVKPCTDKYVGGGTCGSLKVMVTADSRTYRNMTVAERSKFQQSQMDKFCAKYNITNQQTLPSHRSAPVYIHLLVNTQAKTLFCYIPKTGCTRLKAIYLIASGKTSISVEETDQINNKLHAAADGYSLQQRKIDTKTGNKYVREFFKFVMYRHPLERLVSAYRDKVKRFPLKGLGDFDPHFNWVRKAVYEHTHPQEYKTWYKNKGLPEVAISVSDFITAWLETDIIKNNEHFRSTVELCSPCEVRYDYYGNFEIFDQDAKVLAEAIGVNASSIGHGYYSTQRKPDTSTLTEDFYDELTVEQKVGVLKQLSQDIDLYYHLFPVHKDSHKSILNISHDLFVA